jgi:hypothetical protein
MHSGTRKDSLIAPEFQDFSEKSLDLREEERKLYMGPAKLGVIHYVCVLLFVIAAGASIAGAVVGWMD